MFMARTKYPHVERVALYRHNTQESRKTRWKDKGTRIIAQTSHQRLNNVDGTRGINKEQTYSPSDKGTLYLEYILDKDSFIL